MWTEKGLFRTEIRPLCAFTIAHAPSMYVTVDSYSNMCSFEKLRELPRTEVCRDRPRMN